MPLARDRATRSQHAMVHWHERVQWCEQQLALTRSNPEERASLLREAAAARTRRFAAAWTWEFNLRLLVGASATVKEVKEHVQAGEAVAAYSVPLGWGMPRSR